MENHQALGSLKDMTNIRKFFKNKPVLITGHTGFKGSWLSQILLNWGADIIGIALKPATDPSLFYLLDLKKHLNNYFVDIRDFQKVKKIIFKEKPEIVFHLAAQPLVRDSYDQPLYTFETNIIGTANILQAIKEFGGVKSAVMITTDKVYEEKSRAYGYKENDQLGGHDPYSSSKAGAEIVIDSYNKSFFNLRTTLVASARSGNVIGGGDWQKDRLLPDIIKAVFANQEPLIIRNPHSIRPWQHVLEPLSGYLLLAKELYEGKKEMSGAWNFGPGNENYLPVKELVVKALKMLPSGSYVIKQDPAKHEADFLKLNAGKARKFLRWQPIFNLDQTLKLTLDWYKSFYNGKDIIDITNRQIKLFFNEI